MSRRYRLYQIDSFTKEIFSGNPTGVITNADSLTPAEMQRIARELNNSETAFIFPSDSPEYDVHIRFFAPTSEVPICGHATIAAHYARAVENRLGTTKVIQKTGAGILPVDVIKDNGDYRIVMTQGKIRFGTIMEGNTLDAILTALNIRKEDLLEKCPVQIVSTGYSKVMIGIKQAELLHKLNPDMGMLKNISKIINCNGFYVFTMDNPNSDILIHGRMFAPASGINEDPVTGNANGPLGAYLVHYRLVSHDNSLFRFKAIQGEAIGRAGTIDVEVSINNQEPSEVRIAGNAVIVFSSELTLNE